MKVWRGFTLTLWVSLLTLCMAFIIQYHALNATVLNPAVAKTALAQSDAYDKIRDEFLAPQVVDAIDQKIPDNKLIDTPMIKSVLSDVLPRDELVKRIQPAVDSTYAWLDSKEPEVKFSIPLADKKDAFYRSLETKLGDRIGKVVECDAYRYPPEEALLGDLCLPDYVTAREATQALMGYVRASNLSLGDTISQESFTIPSTQLKALKQLPAYFNFLWVLNLLAIAVFAVMAVFVLVTRKSLGFAALGISLVSAGVLAAVTLPFISTLLLPSGEGASAILSSIMQSFIPKLSEVSFRTALLCAGVGAVLIVAAVVWRKLRGRRGPSI